MGTLSQRAAWLRSCLTRVFSIHTITLYMSLERTFSKFRIDSFMIFSPRATIASQLHVAFKAAWLRLQVNWVWMNGVSRASQRNERPGVCVPMNSVLPQPPVPGLWWCLAMSMSQTMPRPPVSPVPLPLFGTKCNTDCPFWRLLILMVSRGQRTCVTSKCPPSYAWTVRAQPSNDASNFIFLAGIFAIWPELMATDKNALLDSLLYVTIYHELMQIAFPSTVGPQLNTRRSVLNNQAGSSWIQNSTKYEQNRWKWSQWVCEGRSRRIGWDFGLWRDSQYYKWYSLCRITLLIC